MYVWLLLVIFLSFYIAGFKPVFWFSFIIGLLSDLVLGNLVGSTSLVLLMTAFFIYLYRRKFSGTHLLFQLIIVLLASFIYNYFSNKNWQLINYLGLILLTLIIFLLVSRIRAKSTGLELEV